VGHRFGILYGNASGVDGCDLVHDPVPCSVFYSMRVALCLPQ